MKCPKCNNPMKQLSPGLHFCIICRYGFDEEDQIGSEFDTEQFKELNKLWDKESSDKIKKKRKEVSRVSKSKTINLNDFAKHVTAKDLGKYESNIAQTKQIMKIVFQKLAAIGDHETLKVVHRYRKKK